MKKFFPLLLFLILFPACVSQPSLPSSTPSESSSQIQKDYYPEIGKFGGNLVLSTSTDPKSFNPILAKETSTNTITQHIFEGLTTIDPITTDLKPQLSERWENSADGLTWTFYLRKDVQWHDGKQFSADDVIFTFNDLIYNPDIPNSSADVYQIDGKKFEVSKIDDFTVQFRLPVKFAPFLLGMSQEILPKHLLESSVRNKTFNQTWGIDAKVSDIVGTGPFFLHTYEPSQTVVLKRNPNYWKKNAERIGRTNEGEQP